MEGGDSHGTGTRETIVGAMNRLLQSRAISKPTPNILECLISVLELELIQYIQLALRKDVLLYV